MDERVFVSIKGLHFASGVQDSDSDGSEDEEVIETVNTGRYKRSGENEYIKYSDMIDGEDKPCSNLIKITPDGTVEITKKDMLQRIFLLFPGSEQQHITRHHMAAFILESIQKILSLKEVMKGYMQGLSIRLNLTMK